MLTSNGTASGTVVVVCFILVICFVCHFIEFGQQHGIAHRDVLFLIHFGQKNSSLSNV